MKLSKCSKMSLIKNAILVILLISFIFYIFFSIKEGFEEKAKKYLDGVDVVYWINLDRSTDRRYNMKEMLKNEAFYGIPKERINAYDGKMDPESVFKKLVVGKKKQTNSEYACLLSHLEAIRTFNESNYNVALIFEDDVTLEFKTYWQKSVKEIMKNAPSDWEIIMLSYTYSMNPNVLFYDWSRSTQEYVENNTDKPISQYYGLVAYLVNKKGSSKLMQIYENNKYKLNNQYDQVSDIYIIKILKTYIYKYPMFIYKTYNDSTIHGNHLQYHIQSKNILIHNYQQHFDDKSND